MTIGLLHHSVAMVTARLSSNHALTTTQCYVGIYWMLGTAKFTRIKNKGVENVLLNSSSQNDRKSWTKYPANVYCFLEIISIEVQTSNQYYF